MTRGLGHVTLRDGRTKPKKPYPTAWEACLAAQRLTAKGFDVYHLIPYRCRMGRHWHLGVASPAHYHHALRCQRVRLVKVLAALRDIKQVAVDDCS